VLFKQTRLQIRSIDLKAAGGPKVSPYWLELDRKAVSEAACTHNRFLTGAWLDNAISSLSFQRLSKTVNMGTNGFW
jgi:hypothetical protein